jgi:LysM repeat protein
MVRKYKLGVWSTLVVLTLLLAMLPAWVEARPPSQDPPPQQLLVNPGFEGIGCSGTGYCEGNWTRDTFTGAVYGEIFTPEGWVTYWSESFNEVAGQDYGRPECKVIPKAAPYLGPPARIRSGFYAVQQFGFHRPIDSGIYQVVTGLTPGATVRLSAYAHAWACDEDGDAYSCGDPYQMYFRVGIDPNGGTNPWGSGVIWAGGYSYDEYRLIGPVEAPVGEAGNVTVFLRATAKWGFKHNDVYWDDASLVYTTPPEPATNTPLPPAATITPGPSPTPGPTSTPRPDGAIVHRVQPGETLYGIALQYGVTPEQILELNAGSIGPNNMIWTDQELVIEIPSNPPTAQSPTMTPTAPITPTPGSGGGTTTGEPGSICVLAFHDRNADTFRQPDTEEMISNATFSIGDAGGLLGQYTTDGLSEPYCFPDLTAGTYQVRLQSPEGYVPSGSPSMAVALSADVPMNIAMGVQRGEAEVSEASSEQEEPETIEVPSPNEEEEEESGESFVSMAGRWVARIGGIVMVGLAVVIGVVFFVSRRR